MYRISRIEKIAPIVRLKAPTKEEWEKLRKRLDAPSVKRTPPKKKFSDYLKEAMEKEKKEQQPYLGQNVNFLY